ncbi:MAG: hypothetical protein RR497_04995 [Oscillospiraceae bacterium]
MDTLKEISNEIVNLIDPQKIILFSHKTSQLGTTTSFKLCVVTKTNEKSKVEHDIYFNICCDIPFDVIVYTPTEWETLKADEQSFAHNLDLKGRVLYER